MKKFLVLLFVLSLLGFSVFAQGNVEIAEKITLLEGTVELQTNPGDKPTIYLLLEDGTKIEIMLSEAAMNQFQFQNREKIQLEGVYLGSTTENKVQEKLFARVMLRNQERVSIKDPVQLSEQERLQLRTYQEEQQVQQMNQQQQQTNQGGEKEAPSSGGSNAGSDKGKK